MLESSDIISLRDSYEVIYPSWYDDGCDENEHYFRLDIEKIKNCDLVLLVGGYLNLYTYCEVYEAYRSSKPIYTLTDIDVYKSLNNILGIKYIKINTLDNLSFSKYSDSDVKIVDLKNIDESIKEQARKLLCDFDKEPIVLVENDSIIFEWNSDPEKVDYCKYLIRFVVSKDIYELKVMYYDEEVCNYRGSNVDSYILRVNKYINDFEKLSR